MSIRYEEAHREGMAYHPHCWSYFKVPEMLLYEYNGIEGGGLNVESLVVKGENWLVYDS